MWIVCLDISPSFTDAFAAAENLRAKILLISGSAIPDSNAWPDGLTKVDVPHSWQLTDVLGTIRSAIDPFESIVVWALKDRLVPLAASLNQILGSTGRWPSQRAIWSTKNKLLMRQDLAGTGLNPRYSVIRGEDTPHPFPNKAVVLKPLEGYASIGVELLEAGASAVDFAASARRSFSVLQSIADGITGDRPHYVPSTRDVLLVEEFIGGLEYSVEVFVAGGKPHVMGICGKSPMVPPYFEEISYMMPAAIDTATQERLTVAALLAVTVLGVTSGMAHVEIKDGENGPKILDVGLRLGGSGLTHDLVKVSSGINLVHAVLAELLAQPSEHLLRANTSDTALLYLLQVASGGTVQDVPSTDTVSSLPRPVMFEALIKTGDRLTPYPAYSGTPGFALFSVPGQGNSATAKAREIVRLCQEGLKIAYATTPEATL
jgi:hypothetical protein